jgi:hypothetical protein
MLKKNICLILICHCLSNIHAQQNGIIEPSFSPIDSSTTPIIVEQVFIQHEREPEFPDGNLALRLYLFSKFQYPKSIIKLIKDKKITVEFRVDGDCAIRQLVFKGALKSRIKNDLIKVFTQMPRFKPSNSFGPSRHYWFYLDNNFSAIADKTKAKIYQLEKAGVYTVIHVKSTN